MSETFKNLSIYIVDDTTFMRAGLTNQLVDLGFEKSRITHFDNGKMALEDALVNNGVDLIFTDWNMPLMTGLDFLKHLRSSNSPNKDVPVVMVTTVSEKAKVIEALKFRLSGYIIKPVDSNKLREVVESIFGEN